MGRLDQLDLSLKLSRKKRHHFLWRFGPALPGWGGKAVLAAVEEMVERTDEPYAPWTLVEGEPKRWARIAAG
jgi:hypothetical protein